METGQSGSALLDRLEALKKEKNILNQMISDPVVDSIRIHSNLTKLYIKKVSGPRDNLNNLNFKNEASQILRSLVDAIRIHPIEKKLQIELVGDLASLIGFGTQYDADIKKPGSDIDPGFTKWLVAGALKLICRATASNPRRALRGGRFEKLLIVKFF